LGGDVGGDIGSIGGGVDGDGAYSSSCSRLNQPSPDVTVVDTLYSEPPWHSSNVIVLPGAPTRNEPWFIM
jgi:hypothetical protein